MKIGIDARLWNQTGVGRYIRNLVHGIDAIESKNPKHDYYIYLLRDEYESLNFKSKSIHKRLADIRWHSLKEQVIFPKVIKKDHLDLMHFTYYSVPYFYHQPYVITLHDLIIYHFMTGEASTLPLPLYRAKHLAYKFLLAQMRKNARQIIVPLEATKKDVVQLFPQVKNKITITREGFDSSLNKIDKNKNALPEKHHDKYFLYVGNAYPHKNVEALIKSFLKFKLSTPDTIELKYHLYLVGKDDFFYKRLKLKYSDPSIHYFHDVSDSELGEMYRNAQALVSPSLMEGFGLPVLEAMSQECLVAASDIPSFREVCGDSALYFDPKDNDDIVRTLKEIAKISKDKKNENIKKGKIQAKKFSWDIMVRETISVYEASKNGKSATS